MDTAGDKLSSVVQNLLNQQNQARTMEADGHCSDDDDLSDIVMFPLLDVENNNEAGSSGSQSRKSSDDSAGAAGSDADDEEDVGDVPMRPLMTLRQRRHSQLLGRPLPNLNHRGSNNSSPIPIRKAGLPRSARGNWMRALRKIPSIEDPWKQFHLNELPTETAIRHRYNALKKRWIQDEVQVKMEVESFNHGAMRACFRMKKLSSFSKSQDWKHASNYVAKKYMEDVARDVYFEDVRLQMDAKLWGEEYNRHNPPKKVDIFQMSILEFKDRPDRPLFHLEHFIEGNYIKYNSNSGFVEESLRLTPQAFSHFTFERSGHHLIIVDIQGVGDLWTDPQIHTSDGEGYGDGNLGTRGMALFFHSHTCNSICHSFNLSRFDLAPSEKGSRNGFPQKRISSATQVRGSEEPCLAASPTDRMDLHAMLMRQRSHNSCGSSGLSSMDSGSEEEPMSPCSPHMLAPGFRLRLASCSETDESCGDSLSKAEERLLFQNQALRMHRPSSVANELNLLNLKSMSQINLKDGVAIVNDSILGQIHHDLAKYHELGRFVEDDSMLDFEAAMYHEVQAAQCGILEAILTLARLYLGMSREVLVNYDLKERETNIDQGVGYMELAAKAGDRSSMIFMAQAYETGAGLGTLREKSYDQAAKWYQKAIETTQADDSGEFDATMDNPVYTLKAKLAEIYLCSDSDLDPDPNYAGELYTEAAEEAMAAMKGRLANKYYSLAEEAWALVEE